jgi:hypothetical protein
MSTMPTLRSTRPLRTLACSIAAVTLGACAETVTAPQPATEAPRLNLFPGMCTRVSQPDLVVTRIASPVATLDLNDGPKPLPLTVTIVNRGTCAAGTFMIGGAMTIPSGFRIDLYFRSTDLHVASYSGRTLNALAAGDSITVRGEIMVSDWVNGQEYVNATVFADDCGSNGTSSCEVSESYETNNRSRAVKVTLAAPSGT